MQNMNSQTSTSPNSTITDNIRIMNFSGCARNMALPACLFGIIILAISWFTDRSGVVFFAHTFLLLMEIVGIVLIIAAIATPIGIATWQFIDKYMSIRERRVMYRKSLLEIALAEAQIELSQYSIVRHDNLKMSSYAGIVESINTESVVQQNRLSAAQLREYNQLKSSNLLSEGKQIIAPEFREMKYLIGGDDLILGYNREGPIYGGVQDLLSMMFVGKPGRGKSSALLYYTAILIMINAIVWVFDPQGSLSEVKGILNYKDTMTDIEDAIPDVYREVQEREDLWRRDRTTRPPMLILIDEIPLIAGYESDNKIGDGVLKLTRKAVLEWRKYNVYVILSGQSLPASVLPTITRDNLASRLVFYSSDAHARMAGLDEESRKKLLPALRKAKAGTAILDVSTRDEAEIASIPYTTVSDLLEVIDGEIVESDNIQKPGSETGNFNPEIAQPYHTEISSFSEDAPDTEELPELKPEISRFSSRQDKKKEIARLLGLRRTQGEIIKKIWKASPGGNAEYKAALAEYKSLVEELVAEV